MGEQLVRRLIEKTQVALNNYFDRLRKIISLGLDFALLWERYLQNSTSNHEIT